MGIRNFFTGREGGFMDVIRCDETDYLIHKWRPSGEAGSTKKENAIRYGSSIRVKEGEVALFMYPQKDGSSYDIIEGPHDKFIETSNFPVLSDIVGAAFGGNSPFQAEVYFINLSGNITVRFGIPYFDVFDPRFMDLGVPCAVRGSFIFNLSDYTNLIKLNRLRNITTDNLRDQVKDAFIRKAKNVIINIPTETTIPVMQLESRIDMISDHIKLKLEEDFRNDFGINLKRLDVSAIELDKSHPHYLQLKKNTADQQTKFIDSKTDIEITHLDENKRIERKETELGVEGRNFAAHQLNLQADVLKTASESLGAMGNIDGDGGGHGYNPIGIMTGLTLGRTMGNQMSGMLNSIPNTPPPPPTVSFHIAINGQQSGPFTIEQLKGMAQNGQFTKEHYIWKQGMTEWQSASTSSELAVVFVSVPPPPPPPTK